MGYFHRLLIAIDQLGNTLADGNPDETISSRVGKASLAGKWWGKLLEPIIDAWFGQGHCRRSIEWDETE